MPAAAPLAASPSFATEHFAQSSSMHFDSLAVDSGYHVDDSEDGHQPASLDHDTIESHQDVPSTPPASDRIGEDELVPDALGLTIGAPSLQVSAATPPTTPMVVQHPIASTSSTARQERPGNTPEGSPAPQTAAQRRSNRRLSLDPRASNRLSGFFSNLLHIHRENPRSTTPEPPTSPTSPTLPSTTTAAPPPSLQAPTLAELGLTLHPVTDTLPDSHSISIPVNGTFLHPHYLLLCHAQGLDVLPLVSPPASRPYALVRRVPFKSVLVMEERGVLIAIAGRRDGVRVYSLEDVRKAIEWRIQAELQRELEKQRRQDIKSGVWDPSRDAKGKTKARHGTVFEVTLPSVPPLPPVSNIRPVPPSPPPTYSNAPGPRLSTRPSIASIAVRTRPRGTSVSTVVGRRRLVSDAKDSEEKGEWMSDAGSDEEALLAAGPSGSAALDERTSAHAASSVGAQPAISSIPSPPVPLASIPPSSPITSSPQIATIPTLPSGGRRHRPANLDLSPTEGIGEPTTPSPIPSPAPTLLTLRQALQTDPAPRLSDSNPPSPNDSLTNVNELITFAEALRESRLPTSPPPSVTLDPSRAQSPSFSLQHATLNALPSDVLTEDELASQHNTPFNTVSARSSSVGHTPDRRQRRRWSVFDGIFNPPVPPLQPSAPVPAPVPAPTSPSREPRSTNNSQLRNNTSNPSLPSHLVSPASRQSLPHLARHWSGPQHNIDSPDAQLQLPRTRSVSNTNRRILSKLFPTSPFKTRHSVENANTKVPGDETFTTVQEKEVVINQSRNVLINTPAPKLEYVKLPGTKGALMIKAVETSRKSFLAILCGEAGEKVELFAGTYRTALGLSRTFILPDSPRSLELQLQGDDLVEVFLVFAQNVFGLEPATVRVREVRIGRAERRAARRRARDAVHVGEPTVVGAGDSTPVVEDETTVTTTVSVGDNTVEGDSHNSRLNRRSRRRSVTGYVTSGSGGSSAAPATTDPENVPSTSQPSISHSEDVFALAAAQLGSYTTFQQLPFAPSFPLASIADDYIIPPTYTEFMSYRAEYEPDFPIPTTATDPTSTTEPTRPLIPSSPTIYTWYYKDPKGVIQGPWKAAAMQSWLQDGFLPLDLPVRRHTEEEYTLLSDLLAASSDPAHPFFPSHPPPPPPIGPATPSPPPPPPPPPVVETPDIRPPTPRVLLQPLSLLAQPKHFGPPALFFSSRGGHSTTIVDSRGRSALKGRILWNQDDDMDAEFSVPRMGDVKRVEPFDANNRAVLVAFRQGGFEAVDVGDALLAPADESRVELPSFNVPLSATNRRLPFTWHSGSSITFEPVTVADPMTPAATLNTTPTNTPRKSSARPVHKTSAHHRPQFLEDGEPTSASEELLVLGRNENDVYFCERNAGTFRILRLSTE